MGTLNANVMMISSYSSHSEHLICFFMTDVNVRVTHGVIDLDSSFNFCPSFLEQVCFIIGTRCKQAALIMKKNVLFHF